MKKRLVPTHFIEVWKGRFNDYIYSGKVEEIMFLDIILLSTLRIGFETIAIWKIRFKDEQHTKI